MATIKIIRSSEYLNKLRNYKLFLNDQNIGTIADGAVEQLDVLEGPVKLIAKIDWCTSNEINTTIAKGETKYFKVSASKNKRLINMCISLGIIGVLLNLLLHNNYYLILGIPVLFYLIYFFTAGRKNYLTLVEHTKPSDL